jgi:NADPH:quinone reductase
VKQCIVLSLFVAETKRITNGRGADLIIDGVGRTTFKGDLEAAAVRGHIVIFGAASGPADPVSPNAFMSNALTVSGWKPTELSAHIRGVDAASK